jgi:uncharacterized protein (DUF433 family)
VKRRSRSPDDGHFDGLVLGASLRGTTMARKMPLDPITRDPGVCSGKACIRGMRFPAHLIVDMVAAGKTTEEISADLPYLEPEDIRQALFFAARLAREEMLASA